MALLGQGVLAIWNGIAAGAEDEFVAWHVREHIPERVSLPGFLRGRRYVALEGFPRYFNFYETGSAADLTSEAYRARLNAPTDWTRSVVRHFTDTTRTVCAVAHSRGRGEGGWVETVRIPEVADRDSFRSAIRSRILEPATQCPGIVAAHLLVGEAAASGGATAEKDLRKEPDKVVAWILLVEGIGPEALRAARIAVTGDAQLVACGAPAAGIERGLYALQFALSDAS
ncbi:MAG TPA: hypothetical protein VH858_01810 [Hyphomicrobiales bacterium]